MGVQHTSLVETNPPSEMFNTITDYVTARSGLTRIQSLESGHGNSYYNYSVSGGSGSGGAGDWYSGEVSPYARAGSGVACANLGFSDDYPEFAGTCGTRSMST